MQPAGWLILFGCLALGFTSSFFINRRFAFDWWKGALLHVLLPPVLYTVILTLFTQWPKADDWIWYFVVLVYLSPLWIGYYTGVLSEHLVRGLRRHSLN